MRRTKIKKPSRRYLLLGLAPLPPLFVGNLLLCYPSPLILTLAEPRNILAEGANKEKKCSGSISTLWRPRQRLSQVHSSFSAFYDVALLALPTKSEKRRR